MRWLLVFALFIGIMEGSIANPAFLFQQPPNFTGHWVILDPPISPSGIDGPVCGHDCDITQDAKALKVTIRGGSARTFKLDGSPETTTSSMGNYSSQTTRTARWDGATLVITWQTGPVGGSPRVGSIARLSLKNGCLVIDSSGLSLKDGRLVENPSGGRGGGKPFVYKLVK